LERLDHGSILAAPAQESTVRGAPSPWKLELDPDAGESQKAHR
jgi:hypothetical protein